MAEDKDLDKVIEKRKQLAALLQQEGQLSARKAKAIAQEYSTLEEISNITNTINSRGKSFVDELNRAVDAGTSLYDVSLGLVESLKESLGIQTRRNEFDRDLFKVNRDITNTIRDQNTNLYTADDVSKNILKNKEKQLAAEKVANSLAAGMGEESIKRVEEASKLVNKRQELEKSIKAELAAAAAGAPYDAQKVADLRAKAALADAELDTAVATLAPAEQQLLYTTKNLAALAELNAKQEARLERIKEINKATGLTGNIIKGLSKLPGLGTIFKASDIEDVKKELLDSGKEADKFQIAGKLASKTFGNLKDTLKDPAFLFTAVTTALVRNSKLTNQFQKELGVSYSNARAMRTEIANAADASGELFINSEKLQKSVFALAENTGVFFDLSSQSAETFTVLTDRMGLAANEAANLTMLARLQGKDTETTMTNMVGTANAALATTKTTATAKDILSDMAKSSKGLQASFAANPGALAKAAVAARELGATLKDIEGTQKSLLSFENSINAELEAELLTGKQLNLEKARTAALNNDLETVSKELMNQGVDLASFSEMNFLQQEKIAAAMGMSRDVMSEMLLKQQTQNMTAEEVRKKFGEQTYEQFKAMDASEKMNAAMAKVKDIFANLLQFITPLIDGFALLLKPIAIVGQILAYVSKLTDGLSSKILGAVIILKMFGMELGGIGKKFMGIFKPSTYTDFFKTLGSKFKSVFGGAADASKGIQFDPKMAGGGRFRDMTSGRMVSEETANAAGVFKPGTGPAGAAAAGATDAAGATGATPAPADNGKALKEKMQNIAEGIKSFADTKVIQGAFNMLLSTPSLIALSIAALPLKLIEKLNGPKLMASMQGIASGVASFASASSGILPLIGTAGALAVLTLGLPGLAGIALLGTAAAAGLAALGPAIASLVVAAPGIPILLAVAAAMALASVPMFAAAMVLESVAKIITAVADTFIIGFQAISSVIIELANNVSFSQLAGIAGGILLLGTSVALLGTIFPAIILGSIALGALSLAINPLAAASGGISVLADSFTQVAAAIQTLDIGKLAILGITVAALTSSLIGLLALGPIGLTALAVVGGVAAIGAGVAAVAGGGTKPTGEATVTTATAGEAAGEDMRAMVEETVTATIKALVPEMVAALKEGQGNIRVTSDPFTDSKQSGQPSINRRINNNSNLIS